MPTVPADCGGDVIKIEPWGAMTPQLNPGQAMRCPGSARSRKQLRKAGALG
jgi:hypothetical protein